MKTLGEVVGLVHGWYPPATAEAWDAVGLVYGDPDQEINRIHLAVDPTLEVAREAVTARADLLLVHHPLFLKPVHGFAATTPKGRTLAALAEARCALLTAHTNADQAVDGVSQALADALGLREQRPVVPAPTPDGDRLEKLTVFVPEADAERVRRALTEAGSGRLGDYDSCTYSVAGHGRFRPLTGAHPAIGRVGDLEVVEEVRIETLVRRSTRSVVVAALLAAHPYEEPAWDLTAVADREQSTTGSGRLGEIEPTTLVEFAATVAAALPETAHGVRVAGDPDRVVRRVAVCGGAGDFLLDDVLAAGVDAYVTSDLRHHPASELVANGGPALVDVAHWAAEWTWLPVLARRLGAALGDTVGIGVSALRTDPWTFRR